MRWGTLANTANTRTITLPQSRLVAEQRRHDREWLLAHQAGRGLVSPIGTLFVERYSDEESVAQLGVTAGELQVATVRPGRSCS